jgi:hypothetical protein
MAAHMPTLLRRCLGLTALMLLAWFEPAAAEELPETPGLANIRRQGWVQFTVSAGRIAVAGSHGVNFNHSGPNERVSVRVTGTEPVVAYEITTPSCRFILDASAGSRLQLRRLPKADRTTPVAVEFVQSPREPIVLKVGSKGSERIYRAESIWHLFLQEPAVAREHLAPLLKILLREWDFVKKASEIESALVRTAESGAPSDQKLWSEWVRQLGDASFAKREAADRRLRESGRIVVTYLQQLDPARLDAEQRYRVRRILQAMSDAISEELPPQVAMWLSGDPAIWLALLSRDEEPTRRAALKRLEAISGGPLPFDPAADRKTRQRQIEAVRDRVSKK